MEINKVLTATRTTRVPRVRRMMLITSTCMILNEIKHDPSSGQM